MTNQSKLTRRLGDTFTRAIVVKEMLEVPYGRTASNLMKGQVRCQVGFATGSDIRLHHLWRPAMTLMLIRTCNMLVGNCDHNTVDGKCNITTLRCNFAAPSAQLSSTITATKTHPN